MPERTLSLFVSSPGDVAAERRRTELVVERLNTEFTGRVRIETFRWERHFYSAHQTFQPQVPQAAACDAVVAIFHGRLGTPLPPQFPALLNGASYPSGTAYEVLTAIEARKANGEVPDIFVFRRPDAPVVSLDAPDRADIETQWTRLRNFFETWFRTREGEFVAAFQDYASTDDFDRKIEDCLRQFLVRRGFTPHGAVWDRIAHGSPFPGLDPFEADRALVFFGRDLAIDHAVARLRDAGTDPRRLPFLLLIGASGAGKSSLLRAGVVPRMVRPGATPDIDAWRWGIVTPGPDPFLALADVLLTSDALGSELGAGPFRTASLLVRLLAGPVDLALVTLREALAAVAAARADFAGYEGPRPAKLLIAIDQAERLFTEAPTQAAAFTALLDALVRDGLAYLIIVLRSDAYALFQSSDTLRTLREAGTSLDLVPPGTAELEEIVTRPVASCDPPLTFEPGLVARLVVDARGGDALPLLQVTLSRLYSAEAARGDGVLRSVDYHGMGDAVTATANDVLAMLSVDARGELPALVSALVSDVVSDAITGSPTPVVTSLDRSAFVTRPARAALVDGFVRSRLLTSGSDGYAVRVRPTHEALLRIWPRAVALWTETAALIRMRHTLEPLVRAWAAAPEQEKEGHLELAPALLHGAQATINRFGDDLAPEMRMFIAKAVAADTMRRTRQEADAFRKLRDAEALAEARKRTSRRTVIGLIIALLLTVAAGLEWRDASRQRDRSELALGLARQTTGGLVGDLAAKLRDVSGAPVETVKNILDRALVLQKGLLDAGESSLAFRRDYALNLREASKTFLATGDVGRALELANQSRVALQRLVYEDPSNDNLKRELANTFDQVGMVQQKMKELSAAQASFHAAFEIREEYQYEKADRDWQIGSAVSYMNLAGVDAAAGRYADALNNLESAMSIFEFVSMLPYRFLTWRPNVSDQNIFWALAGDGARGSELDPAVDNYVQSILASARAIGEARISRQKQSLGARPGTPNLQLDRVAPYVDLCVALRLGGDLSPALHSCEVALDEMKTVQNPPWAIDWSDRLAADIHIKIGHVYQALGDPQAALKSYHASLALAEGLSAKDPLSIYPKKYMSLAEECIADADEESGNYGEAVTQYGLVLALYLDPANKLLLLAPDRPSELAILYAKLGRVSLKAGQRSQAIMYFHKSRNMLPSMFWGAHLNPTPSYILAWFDKTVAALVR